MKRSIKIFIRGLVQEYSSSINRFIELIEEYLLEERTRKLKSRLQSVGYKPKLNIIDSEVSSPRHVILGNNVEIGKGVYLKSEGGIVIGDNSFISDNVTINTVDDFHKGTKKSVVIGKNVRVGLGASIGPGVEIGDGAKIGMGTIVTEDVNDGVSLNYHAKSFEEINFNTQNYHPSYLDIPSDKIYFVLGTGRCGSKSIAKNFNKHTKIYASHEEIFQFIRLSTELAHKEIDKSRVKKVVENLFRHKTLKGAETYKAIIHSDQRLWNFVPILKEIFPQSKFIHLIRNGRDTVRSMYARNWFADDEFEKSQHQWAEYRLNGSKVGDVSNQTWEGWNSFEKCCWYWKYLNKAIRYSLKDTSSFLLKLENVNNEINDLTEFLNIEWYDFKFEKYNSVRKRNKKKYQLDWDDDIEQKFLKIAGKVEETFYNE